jgi:carboxymethylenebutenolidase
MAEVKFPVAGGEEQGYLALPPRGTGPGVLLLHAWWGLTSPFRAACDRLAAAGFVVFAPDLYGGETATTIPEAEKMVRREQGESELRYGRVTGGLAYLRGLPEVQGAKIGLVGFSMGASWANKLASEQPDIVAAVTIFYDDWDLQPGIQAPVIGHYGDQDEFADAAAVDALTAQWQSVVPSAIMYRYPGAHHWFVEENQPDYYDAEATELAWSRTIAFLSANLKA